MNLTKSSPRFRSAGLGLGLAVSTVLAGALVGCAATTSAAQAGPGTVTSSPITNTTNATTTPDPTLRMVTHRGHRLAFHVTPGRQPAIVLDAGGGLDSSYWKDLVPVLARSTGRQIITYDRAGMGLSDEVPGPWRVQDAVSDLDAGLDALHARRVVLVSHSLAGEIATYLARQQPQRVAGAVLVDADLPNFYTDRQIARIMAATQPAVDALLAKDPATLTPAERQLIALAADFVPAHRAYHQVSWPKRLPVTVIVSAKTPFEDSDQDAQAWRDAQAQFVAQAANRRLLVAAKSSHDVAHDRPDVVLAAIKQALRR